MLSVAQEVERLLADMRAAAIAGVDPKVERETTEISAMVMQAGFPEFTPSTPDPIISLYAQAAIVKAWRQLGEKQRGINLNHSSPKDTP